jgi:hypothetical protein
MGSRGRKSRADLSIVPPPPPISSSSPPAEGVPGHLRAPGAAFYQWMIIETDISSTDKLAVLVRACECLDRLAAAQASITELGEITVNQYNQPRLNPAFNLEKTARDGFLACMRMLDIEEAPPPDRYGYRR